MNKKNQAVKRLIEAAQDLLANADDMEESKNDDGKDWTDYHNLRIAVEKAGKLFGISLLAVGFFAVHFSEPVVIEAPKIPAPVCVGVQCYEEVSK